MRSFFGYCINDRTLFHLGRALDLETEPAIDLLSEIKSDLDDCGAMAE